MIKTRMLYYQLFSAFLFYCLPCVVDAFDLRSLSKKASLFSPSSLSYIRQTDELSNILLPEEQQQQLDSILPQHEDLANQQQQRQHQLLQEELQHREKLKKELAVAAIENYDMDAYNAGMTTIAEDIMKLLEQVNPWESPAYHPSLNARWSFVFTGCPTIGMRLITLLSRISVGIPLIDFQDVFLEVSNHNSQVKAIVAVKILDVPLELNVFTKLEPKKIIQDNDNDDDKGTCLIETFEKVVLGGIEIPTPQAWKTSRDLEITYLDQDMMIARTAGGEPHFLLRHSPCSTDDDTCDIDMEVTEYFQKARSKYGSKLSRSLVDRAYNDDDAESSSLDIENIISLIQSILQGKNGH